MNITDKNQLIPIVKKYHNKKFSGRKTSNASVNEGEVWDLSTFNTGGILNSNWKCESIWSRIKFLFHGEITLRILGGRQPAVALVLGEVFKDKN